MKRDLDLSLSIHPVTRDVSTRVGVRCPLQQVEVICSLDRGDLPYRPDLGHGIRRILFENFDDLSASVARRSIDLAARQHVLDAEVRDASVTVSQDGKAVVVSATVVDEETGASTPYRSIVYKR